MVESGWMGGYTTRFLTVIDQISFLRYLIHLFSSQGEFSSVLFHRYENKKTNEKKNWMIRPVTLEGYETTQGKNVSSKCWN